MYKYLWEIIQEENKKNKKTFLTISNNCSVNEVINDNQIDVSCRFNDLFSEFLPYKAEEYNKYEAWNKSTYELQQIDSIKTIANIENKLLHLLGEIDLIRGSSIKSTILKIIKENFEIIFSEEIKIFNQEELFYVLDSYYKLRITGNDIAVLKGILRRIFGYVKIYYTIGSLSIYIKAKKDEEKEKKLNLILKIFTSIEVKINVFWEYNFCIIDSEKHSTIGKIRIY